MPIKALNKINKKVIKEIREVEMVCQRHDKLNGSIFLDASLNFYPDIKNLFLFYEDNKLVSLMTMFIPTAWEAEISAYTLPEYRQKGYFKRLLAEAVEEIKKYDISSLIFVCEADNRIQYAAKLFNELVGIASVSFESGEASIFGFGVSPQYQGKGFGGEILRLLIKDIKNSCENITIEVDSSNQKAFNLYRKCGFEAKTSFEYYRKAMPV